MRTEIISILTAGYGHKEITIRYRNGREYKAVTSDTREVDNYKREVFTNKDDREQRRAARRLIYIVKEANGLK